MQTREKSSNLKFKLVRLHALDFPPTNYQLQIPCQVFQLPLIFTFIYSWMFLACLDEFEKLYYVVSGLYLHKALLFANKVCFLQLYAIPCRSVLKLFKLLQSRFYVNKQM